jgi:hypothetical protein
MKIRTLIALIAFVMTLCAPFQITVHSNPDNKTVSLLTLDVCHAAGAVLSAEEIPCITECPCTLPLSESAFVYTTAPHVFNPLLTTFQQEHPPRV